MTKKESDYTVWKIAAGIVLGLIVWSGIERWQTNRAIAAYNAEIERVFNPAEIERRSKQLFPQIAAAREEAAKNTKQKHEAATLKAQRAQEAATLKPGERCISGQRFRRVENGWEQIGSC